MHPISDYTSKVDYPIREAAAGRIPDEIMKIAGKPNEVMDEHDDRVSNLAINKPLFKRYVENSWASKEIHVDGDGILFFSDALASRLDDQKLAKILQHSSSKRRYSCYKCSLNNLPFFGGKSFVTLLSKFRNISYGWAMTIAEDLNDQLPKIGFDTSIKSALLYIWNFKSFNWDENLTKSRLFSRLMEFCSIDMVEHDVQNLLRVIALLPEKTRFGFMSLVRSKELSFEDKRFIIFQDLWFGIKGIAINN